MLKKIFTWWNGATIGTLFTIKKQGEFVGEDSLGNRYYEARTARDSYDVGRRRRWVIYKGYAEASKIPPEWHGWMHYTWDEPPTKDPVLRRAWELDHQPNLTGSAASYRPAGHDYAGGKRAAASGDYESWTPGS